MRFKYFIIPISIIAITLFVLSCTLPPKLDGTYSTELSLHIEDTMKLDIEDALYLMIIEGLLELQDVNTTFNTDRTGFATTQLLGAPDTLYFDWNYHHGESVQIMFEDSTDLILNYNSDGECWQAEFTDDAFTLFFTFTSL